MNNALAFLERQSGNYNGRYYDSALERLCVHKSDSWKGIAPSTDGADFNPEPPIFTAKFAKCRNQEHILAIANEDGKIALQDTNQRSDTPEDVRALAGQHCHYNAVFDLEWMPGEMKFISASGDHTAQLWEVRESTFENSRVFNGHTRSVKTAAFRKTDSAVFATGGRDGAILIWDTRAALNVGVMPRADNCIYSGHSGGPGTPQSCKRRTRHTPKLPSNVSSSSITGLVFQDENTLVSCGAGDGIIKVWDMRRNYTSYKKEPLPKHSIPYPGSSTFKGYTNLIVDNAGVKLYVNCMDNNIYAYNLATYDTEPLIRYKGLRNSTFYIKSSLSPDGQYLLSGSSDEKAYIWNVKHSQPLLALVGHTVEVTCVAWSCAKDMRIVTCSDDARHKIWRIGPELIEQDELVSEYRGTTEVFKDYYKTLKPSNQLKVRLKSLENTPRSIRRLVEENETTPSTAEVPSNKRSFAEMAGLDDLLLCHETACGSDAKRPNIESKGRRLFSPVTSTSTASCSAASSSSVFFGNRQCATSNLASILEESTDANAPSNSSDQLATVPMTPNTPCTPTNSEYTPPSTAQPTSSVLSVASTCNSSLFMASKSTPVRPAKQLFSPPSFSDRPCFRSIKSPETPPSSTSTGNTTPLSSHFRSPYQVTAGTALFMSPTSNLPNFVVNGEAPHLQLQSPKRKLKENVDWLTKIRKQKLLSTINSQLNEKLSANNVSGSDANSRTTLIGVAPGGGGSDFTNDICMSPRLQSLKASGDSSPSTTTTTTSQTPRRRTSRSGSDAGHPKTPTSSNIRRNPEHTLLRFFTVKSQSSASAAANRNNHSNNNNHSNHNGNSAASSTINTTTTSATNNSTIIAPAPQVAAVATLTNASE